MKFACAISQENDSQAAAEAVMADLSQSGMKKPDAVFVFLTSHHTSQAEEILQRVQDSLSPQCVIGASAEGVIGGELEIERKAGLAILAGDLGGALIKSFHIGRDDWRRLIMEDDALSDAIGYGQQTRALIGL